MIEVDSSYHFRKLASFTCVYPCADLRTQVFLMQTLETLDAADKFLHYLHFDYFYIRNV